MSVCVCVSPSHLFFSRPLIGQLRPHDQIPGLSLAHLRPGTVQYKGLVWEQARYKLAWPTFVREQARFKLAWPTFLEQNVHLWYLDFNHLNPYCNYSISVDVLKRVLCKPNSLFKVWLDRWSLLVTFSAATCQGKARTVKSTDRYFSKIIPLPPFPTIINRPSVAGDVLQTALSLIDWLIDSLSKWPFVKMTIQPSWWGWHSSTRQF